MLDAADSTPVRIIPYGVGGQLGTLPDGIGGHTPPQALRSLSPKPNLRNPLALNLPLP